FTARRLLADAVLVVFAARDAPDSTAEPAFSAPGVEEMPVTGLDEAACATLLAWHHLATPLAGVRLAELTLGNPLALVELARVLAATDGVADPTTMAAVAGAVPTTRRLESVFAAEVRSLAEPDRVALLVCAAAGTGELATL